MSWSLMTISSLFLNDLLEGFSSLIVNNKLFKLGFAVVILVEEIVRMIRGNFHLFACRSGEVYARKLVKQLDYLIACRKEVLDKKDSLSLYDQNEMNFIRNISEMKARIGKSRTMHFDDGEMNVIIDPGENVRDKDVFLVQCFYNPSTGLTISENLMEAFIFIEALRRAKAKTVTLISLYYPYGRGDKQHSKDGVPASLLAQLLTAAGMHNIITMDLHADQITGFFDPKSIRIEHVHAAQLLIHYFKDGLGDDAKIVAPDAGAAKRTQYFAAALHKSMVLAYKKRDYNKKHVVSEMKLLGLPGKEVLILDDIIGSGGSMFKVMDRLSEKGVEKAILACTHPLFVGDAVDRFDRAYKDKDHPFSLLVGTDAVPQTEEVLKKPWYVEIDTSRFIAKVIYEMHTSGRVSKLFRPYVVEELDLWVGTGSKGKKGRKE